MSSINETAVGWRLLRDDNGGRERQEPNRQEEIVGDSCKTKEEQCIRLMSQNVNGIGQEANSAKEIGIKDFILNNKIDIMAIQQLNVCWSKVSNINKIWDRFRRWRENHNISVAYDTTDKNANCHQPGGVALIAVGKITHTWESSGYDKEQLGRWAWSRYQGSYGRHLRVVSVYRPCINTQKIKSIYMKQYSYSLRKREGKCPRELFLNDLTEEIKKWKNMGDSIIIMGDFNQDVRSRKMRDWKEELELEDLLLERVEREGVKLNTYSGGHAPIDSIMCTQGIEVRKAGYLEFGEGVGDHRPIFIDITISSTLGVNIPVSKSVKARRLKTNDPRIMKKYIETLRKFLKKSNMTNRVLELQSRITQPLDEDTAKEFEKLDRIRIQGMMTAERRCRKLKMGGVPWTPELSRIRNTIEVWQLVLKRLKGYQVSARTILRKKNKAGMSQEETNVPTCYAISQIRIYFKKYKEYLRTASEKRQTFQDELAQARAREGSTKVSKEIEKIKRIEAQRESARRIKKMNGTLRPAKGLTKVVVTNSDGAEVELVGKLEMEKALLDEYEKTLTQSNRTHACNHH